MKPGCTCQSCGAFAALSSECRALSPKPFIILNAQKETMVVGAFPAVKPDHWCAEWRPDSTVVTN